MIKIFKKCVCITLTLVMAQGVAVTSLAAETSANQSSATLSTVESAAKTITDYITLGVGQAKNMTAVFPISGKVTYTSGNAKVVKVTSGGKMTVLKTGGATVTAAMENGDIYKCYVTAVAAPTSLKLNKTTAYTGVGKSLTLTATTSPAEAVKTVTWKSSNTSIATVSSNGVVKAIKNGTVTITVSTYNGLSASCKITVKPAPTAIKLDTTALTLEVGKTSTLVKTFTPSNAYPSVTWSSDNSSIASVSSDGTVTAKSVGNTVIKVTTYNGKSVSCKVTVKEKALSDTEKVIQLVNEERKKAGASALTANASLNKAAQKRAEEISSSFSHTRPDGSSCFTVLKEFSVNYSTAGENIAAGQKTPEDVMTSWMSSAGHKKNILNSNFKSIGVGCYVKDGCKYWVQLFIG